MGASQVALVVKNPPANAGDARDVRLIPGSGRSLGGGHGNPLQYSCPENSHGQRRLADYNPWSHQESDMTDQLKIHTHMVCSHIAENAELGKHRLVFSCSQCNHMGAKARKPVKSMK